MPAIERSADKNSYGGHTDRIQIHSLYHIFIHGTTEKRYVVEFKEWRWISYKIRFSFVSEKDIEETVKDAFDKVLDYFQDNSDFDWPIQNKIKMEKDIIHQYRTANWPDEIS